MNLDEYNESQIELILNAKERGLPIEKYIRPKFSSWTIRYLMRLLNAQELLYFYKRGFKLIELHQIDKFINDGFGPKIIDNLDFDFRQMREIRKALRSGISITKLANPNLTWKEIRARRIKAYVIKKGIEFYITNYKKL